MRSFATRAVIALVIPTWLIACSNSPTNPSCTVNSVTITGAPTALDVDATVQLGTTIDSDDCNPAPTATWSTSSGAIATVSNTGLVTGVSAGEVTITATAGGKSGTATFDVEVTPVASVRLTPAEIVIGVGPGATLVAEALDAEDNVLTGRTVTWSVSGGSGATISNTGQLTGVTAGETATITASIEGVEADAQVHVVRSRLAFFWNDFATPVGTVSPDEEYAYSSLAGALTIASGGTGQYAATFNGQGRQANETEAYFLSPYSAAPGSWCINGGWGGSFVNVECYDAAGDLANMRFTVAQLSSAAFPGRYAYAWIPSGAFTTDADPGYMFSSSGGEISSIRNGTGDYTVVFTGLGRATGNDREGVIVNGYADDASCQPASWLTAGTGDLEVSVRCFDAAGAPADSRFVILVVSTNRPGATLAFAHADQPATGAYSPANSAVRPTGSAQVNRNSTGHYSVAFTGLYRSGDLEETFLVTATGTTPGRCQVDEWSYSNTIGTAGDVFISCATPAGVAADMPFSVVVLQ